MQRYWLSLAMIFGWVWLALPTFAAELQELRIKPLAYGTEVNIKIKGDTQNKLFTLDNPPRLVLDMLGGAWRAGAPQIAQNNTIKHVRHAQFKPGELRVVFDLYHPTTVPLSTIVRDIHGQQWLRFTLEGSAIQPRPKVNASPRAVAHPKETSSAKQQAQPASMPIVTPTFKPTLPPEDGQALESLDWTPVLKPQDNKHLSHAEIANRVPVPVLNPKRAEMQQVNDAAVDSNTPTPIFNPRRTHNAPIIVIDAGHGGIDPGAIGIGGTKEKHITLRYARLLQQGLEETGRYRVKLIREKDSFLRLRERIAKARNMGGKLFISLHADSAPTKMARGLSVYTLSEEASDAEAAQLARQENRVDALGSMDLSSEPDDVASILIDLAQRDTQNKSSLLAEIMVAEYGKRVRLRKHTHRYAGFAVLKSPDIPSVLIELGFLSNHDDERLLQTRAYEKKVLAGTIAALDYYMEAQHRTNPLHYSAP